MAESSPYQQLRQIGFTINRFGVAADLDMQSTAARRSFEALRRNIQRAQDVLKDYEMFELEEDTRKQAQLLPKAVKALQTLRDSLLKASEYDLIGAVDIAQISAEIDELADKLH
jgi:hypothetical protein